MSPKFVYFNYICFGFSENFFLSFNLRGMQINHKGLLLLNQCELNDKSHLLVFFNGILYFLAVTWAQLK